MADTPNIKSIFEAIQNEFNSLDRQIGSHGKRLLAITDVPVLARDLYLIHDIVAITCDSGTGTWIAYHHDEPNWVDCAAEAFERIGHPYVTNGIRGCLAIFLSKGDSMTYKDDEVPSNYIIDHEHEIMRSLYSYLLARGYEFRSPAARQAKF